MKAKVIKPFGCKLRKINYFVGDIYEGDEKRIIELQKLGYLDGTPNIIKEAKPNKRAKGK